MCLDNNVQTFDPPKPEIIKAYKLFQEIDKKLYAYSRFNLEKIYPINQWIEDYCISIIGKSFFNYLDQGFVHYDGYQTGFHAFVNLEDAWKVRRGFNVEIYEVELTDITALGKQHFINWTPFAEAYNLPCVVARKMKINHKIVKTSVVEIKGSCA